MGNVNHDQANLVLRLYEARREARLREAREWYIASFHPQTPEDVAALAPPGSRENTSMRMVTSYWAMAAAMVNRGLIDEEFFFETSGGEPWIVWERLKPIVAESRKRMKNPNAWAAIERLATAFEAWREKQAPGANDAMRQMMAAPAPNAGRVGFGSR
ncbi:MAG: DUF4760 domain-containing protein [Terriglobales bacterium]